MGCCCSSQKKQIEKINDAPIIEPIQPVIEHNTPIIKKNSEEPEVNDRQEEYLMNSLPEK